ncbi:unnamed protein product, partial [Prorocentrum cordatum]
MASGRPHRAPRANPRGHVMLPEHLYQASFQMGRFLRYVAFKRGMLDDQNWMELGLVLQELRCQQSHPVDVCEADVPRIVELSYKNNEPRFDLERRRDGSTWVLAALGASVPATSQGHDPRLSLAARAVRAQSR